MSARASLASRLRLNRAQWVRLIADVRRLVRHAESAAGEALGPAGADALAGLRRSLVGAKGEDFPNPARIASTGLIAEAFVNAARAFALASPERRSEIAPALGELARLLDGRLETLRAAEAAPHYWAGRD